MLRSSILHASHTTWGVVMTWTDLHRYRASYQLLDGKAVKTLYSETGGS